MVKISRSEAQREGYVRKANVAMDLRVMVTLSLPILWVRCVVTSSFKLAAVGESSSCRENSARSLEVGKFGGDEERVEHEPSLCWGR